MKKLPEGFNLSVNARDAEMKKQTQLLMRILEALKPAEDNVTVDFEGGLKVGDDKILEGLPQDYCSSRPERRPFRNQYHSVGAGR